MAVMGVAVVVCIVGGVAYMMFRDTGAGKSGADDSITPPGIDGSIAPPGTGGSITPPVTDGSITPQVSQDHCDDDVDEQDEDNDGLLAEVSTDEENEENHGKKTIKPIEKAKKDEGMKPSGWFDWFGFGGSADSTTKQVGSSSGPKRLPI